MASPEIRSQQQAGSRGWMWLVELSSKDESTYRFFHIFVEPNSNNNNDNKKKVERMWKVWLKFGF